MQVRLERLQREVHNLHDVGSNPTPATIYGAVAQLAEASVLGTEGCGFDSLQPYHKYLANLPVG